MTKSFWVTFFMAVLASVAIRLFAENAQATAAKVGLNA